MKTRVTRTQHIGLCCSTEYKITRGCGGLIGKRALLGSSSWLTETHVQTMRLREALAHEARPAVDRSGASVALRTETSCIESASWMHLRLQLQLIPVLSSRAGFHLRTNNVLPTCFATLDYEGVVSTDASRQPSIMGS